MGVLQVASKNPTPNITASDVIRDNSLLGHGKGSHHDDGWGEDGTVLHYCYWKYFQVFWDKLS